MLGAIADAKQKERQDQLHDAAFIGWQVAAFAPRQKPFMSFDRYMKKLGISQHDKGRTADADERTQAIEQARQIGEQIGGLRFG